MLNALTVDVEDYYHVEAFADRIDRAEWDQYPSRVVANTRRVLAILDEREVHATFFVLGWVAERFPQLVREIQAAGHEIGCHSYWHRLVYRMTQAEFRNDLRRATGILQDISGAPVTAFRAPSFSITEQSLWALDILIEEGYRYDSSIFPIHHDKYGIPGARRFPHRINSGQWPVASGQWAGDAALGAGLPTSPERPTAGLPETSPQRNPNSEIRNPKQTQNPKPKSESSPLPPPPSLHEFPPSVCRLFGCNLPVAGGGYFRLYPAWLSLRWLGTINRRDRQPFMFYLHPWELDPEQPRLACSLRSRFRHYQNLATTDHKLRRLLGAFRFGTITRALEQAGGNPNREIQIPKQIQTSKSECPKPSAISTSSCLRFEPLNS